MSTNVAFVSDTKGQFVCRPIAELEKKGYFFEEVRFFGIVDAHTVQEVVLSAKSARTFLFLDKSELSGAHAVFGKYFETTLIKTDSFIRLDGEKGELFLADKSAEKNEITEILSVLNKEERGFGRMVFRAVGLDRTKFDSLIYTAQKTYGNLFKFRLRENFDDFVLEIFYDSNAPKMASDELLRLFSTELERELYSLDDYSLEETLVSLLKLRDKKLSVAESFTGGGVAKRITSVSGASKVYFEGLNTYDEKSKAERLSVSEYTLNTQGAVSDQTAFEMADGLLRTGNCDVALATTGIAGPSSDRFFTPVGTVFISVGLKENIYVSKYHFTGTREEITEKGINHALFDAIKHLKNM